ncbi:MAG: MarR family transcriptional regulator [Methanosarcinales archaeon]|nr:MarR family transcriptional regulator [Methanosarcinales archaeon]
MSIQGKQMFIAALFIASIFILGMKLTTPTPIKIFVEGSDVVTSQIPGFYTLVDMFIAAVSAFLLGISTMYLLFFDSKSTLNKNLEHIVSDNVPVFANSVQMESTEISAITRKGDTKEILKILKGSECEVAKTLFEFGELNQAELASRTDIPKSTLSRTLANLEKRGVISRYENGMSKMVKLADDFQK